MDAKLSSEKRNKRHRFHDENRANESRFNKYDIPSFIHSSCELRSPISRCRWKLCDRGATQTLPSGISIAAVNFAANNAVFNPNSTSSTGSITLQNSKTQRKLTLTPSTGRVTISQPGE